MTKKTKIFCKQSDVELRQLSKTWLSNFLYEKLKEPEEWDVFYSP